MHDHRDRLVERDQGLAPDHHGKDCSSLNEDQEFSFQTIALLNTTDLFDTILLLWIDTATKTPPVDAFLTCTTHDLSPGLHADYSRFCYFLILLGQAIRNLDSSPGRFSQYAARHIVHRPFFGLMMILQVLRSTDPASPGCCYDSATVCLVREALAMFCAIASATIRVAHFTKSLPVPIHREHCCQLMGLRYITVLGAAAARTVSATI
jgi:hypothetical protein